MVHCVYQYRRQIGSRLQGTNWRHAWRPGVTFNSDSFWDSCRVKQIKFNIKYTLYRSHPGFSGACFRKDVIWLSIIACFAEVCDINTASVHTVQQQTHFSDTYLVVPNPLTRGFVLSWNTGD